MPEATIKYYPVLARLLMTLGGLPLVTFRAAVVSQKGSFAAEYDVVHRFVTGYKGRSEACDASNETYVDHSRNQVLVYLKGKCERAERDGKKLEPTVEIFIDLRAVKTYVQP